MENVVLILCLVGLGCVLIGRTLERAAKLIRQMGISVGHVTEFIAGVAVILVLVSPLGLGHKHTAEAMRDISDFVRHMIAAVHGPGR